jgi:hypothetical protein
MWTSGVWSLAAAEAARAEPASRGAPVESEAASPAHSGSTSQTIAEARESGAAPAGTSVGGGLAAAPAEPEVAADVAALNAGESSAVSESPAGLDTAQVETTALAAELAAPSPDSAEAPPGDAPVAGPTPGAVEARAEIASGRSYLDAGDPMMAALHFGVAIRLEPASASAVLDAIGDRQDLPLQLVRGDALRLLGLEGDAGKAYLSVASALGAPKPAVLEPSSETGRPAPVTSEPEPEPPAAYAEPEPEPEPESAAASAEPEPESAAAYAEPEPEPEPPAAYAEPEPEPPAAYAEPEPEPEAASAEASVEDPPPIRWD